MDENLKKEIKFVNGLITEEIREAVRTAPDTAFFWSGCATVDASTGNII